MRPALAALALAALLAAGCKKKQEAAPGPEQGSAAAPVIGEAELKRGHDACADYVAKVCACAEKVEAVKERCKLSKALPESIEVTLEVATHPETERRDARQSADSIRKTIARCIEGTAKLPSLGCP